MSNLKYQVDCTNEKSYRGILDRQKQQKKKKKQVVTSSSHEVETVSDDVLPLDQVVQRRGKRTAESNEPTWTDGSVNFSIPANASVHTGYDALSGQLGQLLLDEDKARLAKFSMPSRMARMACGHSMAAYQHSLFMMNALEEGERRVAELERERSSFALEKEKARKEWSFLEHFLRDQLAAKEQELEAARASVAEVKAAMVAREALFKEEM
ncbi:uncharacterized protein LOC131004521 [Salvia miltiorrhiza]|uniref:uncharacterized protein LOC131004521 n=1 Tax=Salvia miltiorrhiza TaxID=226208 RepID=UPI0025AB9AC6|nr:uncharacterized protein LOC131004521 [Salvia miltiorrhiza]